VSATGSGRMSSATTSSTVSSPCGGSRVGSRSRGATGAPGVARGGAARLCATGRALAGDGGCGRARGVAAERGWVGVLGWRAGRGGGVGCARAGRRSIGVGRGTWAVGCAVGGAGRRTGPLGRDWCSAFRLLHQPINAEMTTNATAPIASSRSPVLRWASKMSSASQFIVFSRWLEGAFTLSCLPPPRLSGASRYRRRCSSSGNSP